MELIIASTSLSGLRYLKMQEVVRAKVLELTPQTWYVGSKKKELRPESLWVYGIIFILVFLVSWINDFHQISP